MPDPNDRVLPSGTESVMIASVGGADARVPRAMVRQRLPGAPAWGLEHIVALREGRLVVEELRIFPGAATPAGGLTTRLVRRATIGAHLDHVAEIISTLRAIAATSPNLDIDITKDLAYLTAPREPAPRPTGPARPGRKRLTDDVLLAAARAYVAARQAGAKAPVVVAATAEGMTVARFRDLVHRARLRGFLTETQQGYGRGQLTPLALRLLKKTPRPKPPRRKRARR